MLRLWKERRSKPTAPYWRSWSDADLIGALIAAGDTEEIAKWRARNRTMPAMSNTISKQLADHSAEIIEFPAPRGRAGHPAGSNRRATSTST